MEREATPETWSRIVRHGALPLALSLLGLGLMAWSAARAGADQRIFVPGVAANTGHPNLLPGCYTLPLPADRQPGTVPVYEVGARYASEVETARERYEARHVDYYVHLQEYRADGDYLNYGLALHHRRDPTLRFDARDIPMVAYDGIYHYHPVTIAQYALSLHGKWLHGTEAPGAFLNVAGYLAEVQDAVGALRFPFPYVHYRTGETFAAGWTSGMAQGLGLSVFARAYALTGEDRYLVAAQKALNFLTHEQTAGGTMTGLSDLDPSLAGFITFEEYPTTPTSLTLNGFAFTLLGLHDWASLGPPDDGSTALAAAAFACGMATLLYTLPFYDVGGFSAYDLGHIVPGGAPNLQVHYHAIHISLLHALNSIAPHPLLAEYEQRWRAYVDPGTRGK